MSISSAGVTLIDVFCYRGQGRTLMSQYFLISTLYDAVLLA
jgi:hypothetical protein